MEQSIQHRGVWLASVAHRQWRRGINAGGCVKPSKKIQNIQNDTFHILIYFEMSVFERFNLNTIHVES